MPRTILLIEDDQNIRTTTQMILEILGGYTCVAAESGAIAKRLLQEAGTKFDLILLDIRMPELNGIEFLNDIEITLLRGSTPVLAMSGSCWPQLNRARIGFIQKPFEVNKLLAKISECLEYETLRVV